MYIYHSLSKHHFFLPLMLNYKNATCEYWVIHSNTWTWSHVRSNRSKKTFQHFSSLILSYNAIVKWLTIMIYFYFVFKTIIPLFKKKHANMIKINKRLLQNGWYYKGAVTIWKEWMNFSTPYVFKFNRNIFTTWSGENLKNTSINS